MTPRLARILATAIGVAAGCAIPSTLGLPCIRHDHCDPGQHCGPDQTCVSGPPSMPGTGSTDDGPILPSSSGQSSAAEDTTPALDTGTGTTGSTTAVTTTDDGTTGPACGRAIGSCDAVDVLFLVDNSGSMVDDNTQLIPAFADVEGLVSAVIDGPCTFRIGVTTTESALEFQPLRCQQRGALSRAGAICPDPWPGDPEHPPWIAETDEISQLGCLLAVGTEQDTDEKQLDTLIAALGPDLQGPGGCNEGFMRPGVPLLVILVTDEDDDDDSDDPAEAPFRTGSAGDPSDWWEQLTARKPASELGMVVLAATDPAGCDWMPSTGDSDGTGAEYAERILTFLQHFTGAGYSDHFRVVDLCQPAEDLLAEITVAEQILADVCADVTGA
jgi:hypothetical protein